MDNKTAVEIAEEFEGNHSVSMKSLGLEASNGYWCYFTTNDEGAIVLDNKEGGWNNSMDEMEREAFCRRGLAELLYAFDDAGFDLEVDV